MNDADYRTLYYLLVEKELRRLIELAALPPQAQADAEEYIRHAEYGLVLEIITSQATANSPELTEQCALLANVFASA